MAAYEWLVVVYFVGLTIAAWFVPADPARRRQAAGLGIAVVLTVFAVATAGSFILRAWIPVVYLVAGYWMPALLVGVRRDDHFEAWLTRSDTTLRRWLPPIPAAAVPLLELAYLLCYPLVPLSFTIVWLEGGHMDVQRFWLVVLLSGYACYGTLPWLISRPPRARRVSAVSQGGLRRLNTRVLESCSHQLNTFPSGHVAVAAAAAAGVSSVSTAAGVIIGAVAGAITVGAAAGGYHYVVDVILGLIAAAVAATVAGLL